MRARSWIAAASGASLVITAALVGAGGITSASASNPGPVGTPQASTSTLTWKTDKTGTSVTYSAPKSGQSTQTFTAKNCVFSSGGTQYLTFDVTGPMVGSKAPGVGLKAGSLGVRSGNDSNGTSCAQVNTGTTPQETLTINVDPAATSGTFGPGQILSAALDLNLSGNAIVRAQMRKADGTLVGLAELQSGFSAPQTPGDDRAQLQVCNFDSNSGPQSGYNNNCYWNIAPLTTATGFQRSDGTYIGGGGYVGPTSTAADAGTYTSITLTPIVGAFSIQGGDSYPSTMDGSAGTIFTIASYSDGTIGCYDGTDATLSSSQTAPLSDPRAVLTRLQLGDANATCTAKAYSLDYTSNTVTYHQQLTDGQLTSQYALVLPRDYAAGTRPDASLPPIKVNWEDGTADVTLTFCPAGLITATSGQYFVPTQYDYSKAGTDQSNNSPGKQYACVYKQTVSVNGSDGLVTSFDYIYFAGDARFAP